MKTIARTDLGEPISGSSWPRHTVKSIETRKRDVIVRIADWTRTKDAPCFDVEVYIHGVYDWNESKQFDASQLGKAEAKRQAAEFAAKQFAKFL